MKKTTHILVALFVTAALAATGVTRAALVSCLPDCGHCLTVSEPSCCGSGHDQGHYAGGIVRQSAACCHSDLIPGTAPAVARTGLVPSIDPPALFLEPTLQVRVSIAALHGNRRPPMLQEQYRVPIYLDQCAFLI